MAESLEVGARVFWTWKGRPIAGKVVAVYFERVERVIKGKRIVRNGTPERPAYLVVSEAGNEALKLSTELRQLEKTLGLRPLPWMLGSALLCLLLTADVLARTQEIIGIARGRDGKTAYIEKHEVEYAADGKLLRARTSYESPEGKPLALLKSDFTSSLTVPDHTVEDFRTGDVEGLRREGDKIVLFDREKDRMEKTRVLDAADGDSRILVGCQGLNYYVLGNLDTLDPEKPLPLRFLIPGRLDYYDFDMKEVGSPDPSLAEFEISIKSWLLRLFAPKLRARYERKTRRLVWYDGLSNIKNADGDNQSVTITYTYRDPKETSHAP